MHSLKTDELWLPFTANRRFKKHPKLFKKACGMYYTTIDDRQVLDATAGLWCVNAGHCRQPIVEAIQKQAQDMDYAPGFQLSHPLAFELANRLALLAPGDLKHVFFTNSGSESADTALKIALAYQQAKGETHRNYLVGRERGYHGVGFGGISVGGIANNRKHFSLLPNTFHLPHTHDLTRNAFSHGLPEHGLEYADTLLTVCDDTNKIAAVIVEPMAGSTGVLLPPQDYLQRLRQLCDQIGALLIFDEVITAFGRIGGAFASDFFGVTPDIITTAKGLTNGSVPMGAVLVKSEIYETIVNHAPEKSIEFFHGYTYSGHPLACAAAMASLDVYEQGNLLNRAQLLSNYWQKSVHSLRECPHVIDIRNLGLVAAIELDSRENQPGRRAMDIFDQCFEEGILIRVTGDTIALSPPLIISEPQIDETIQVLNRVIKSTV